MYHTSLNVSVILFWKLLHMVGSKKYLWNEWNYHQHPWAIWELSLKSFSLKCSSVAQGLLVLTHFYWQQWPSVQADCFEGCLRHSCWSRNLPFSFFAFLCDCTGNTLPLPLTVCKISLEQLITKREWTLFFCLPGCPWTVWNFFSRSFRKQALEQIANPPVCFQVRALEPSMGRHVFCSERILSQGCWKQSSEGSLGMITNALGPWVL